MTRMKTNSTSPSIDTQREHMHKPKMISFLFKQITGRWLNSTAKQIRTTDKSFDSYDRL